MKLAAVEKKRSDAASTTPNTHCSLLTEPQLLRDGGNPIPLSRIISKHLKAAPERLLGTVAFTKHNARSDQLDPPVRVMGRLFQAIGKTINHPAYHG